MNVVDTNGDYPVSVAVNSTTIAVLNGGTKSNIRAFTWTSNGNVTNLKSYSRSIKLMPTQSNPPNGPPNTVSQILFSPDNKCLLVLYKGTSKSNPGGLLIYPITNNGLSTNPVKTVLKDGFLPFGMKTVGQNGLIVTNASNGVNFVTYDSSTGLAKSSKILPIDGAVCWVTYSPLTNNYYVIGATSNDITEVNVNQGNLKLINTYHLPMGSNPNESAIVAINNNNYLYVNCPGSKNITILSLNSSGNAKIIGTVNYPADYSSPKIVGMATKLIGTSDYGLPDSTSSNSLFYNPWIWILIIVIIIILVIWFSRTA